MTFVPFDEFDQDSKFPHKSSRGILHDLVNGVRTIQAGVGITVDDTDPENPFVSAIPYVIPQASEVVLGGIRLGENLIYDSESGLVNVPVPVQSVNGMVGDVVLDATDVGADPAGSAVSEAAQITSTFGVADGVATLASDGKHTESEIRRYNYTNLAAFPAPGTEGVIYIAEDSNKLYRWDGTSYEMVGGPQPPGAYIYNTKAEADAAVSTLADQALVTVLVDESLADIRSLYRKENDLLVFKYEVVTKDVVDAAVVDAEAAKTAAEAARDAAQLSAGVYADTASGIAATTSGDYFSVPSADASEYLILYKNNAGLAQEIRRYPSGVAVSSVKAFEAANASQRLDQFIDLSRAIVQQTLGGSVAPFVYSQEPGGGLNVECSSSTRHYVMSTDFVARSGLEQEFVLASTGIRVDAGVFGVGIAIGPAGVGRRIYMYRSDGFVASITDAEAVTTIAAADAGRSFSTGSAVSIKVRRKSDGSGSVTIVLPGGSEQSFAVTGIPQGTVWLAHRGDGAALYTQMYSEIINGITLGAIAEAGAAQVSATERSALFAMQEFLRPIAVADPAGFTGLVRDFSIYRRGDRTFFTDLDFAERLPFQEAAATVLYVDVATGSDSNSGSAAAPLKSIYQAVHGRSGNVWVYVKPGLYAGNDGWRDANPTCNLVVMPWGNGRVVSSRHLTGLSWALSSGQTKTYQSTITTVGSVVDAANVDGHGDYTRLTSAASIAAVEATAGTYYVSGTTVYVHTFNDRVPDASLRVYPNLRNGRYQQPSGVVWIKGVDFEGGSRPMQLAAVTAGQTNVGWFWDCAFKYAGGSSGQNGLNTDGRCFTYAKGCVAAANALDGFNYHYVSGGLPPVAVEIECIGRNNGHNASGTNNGSTMHDGGSIIRIGGRYFGNENRNVHDVNSSYSWNLGVYSADSRGPASKVNFAAGTGTDGTMMWLDQCVSSGSDNDFETVSTSVIKKYDSVDGGRAVSGSDVQAYVP
jgi:hypothetical protein